MPFKGKILRKKQLSNILKRELKKTLKWNAITIHIDRINKNCGSKMII